MAFFGVEGRELETDVIERQYGAHRTTTEVLGAASTSVECVGEIGSETCVSDALGDRFERARVVPLRLVGESEEHEEDDSAHDAAPSRQLECGNRVVVAPPESGGNLINQERGRVDRFPSGPWDNDIKRHLGVEAPYTEGNGAENVDATKGHQTDVTTEVNAAG